MPPPARKVVVEKLADQPQKPQNFVIEKWLPYKPRTRRIVYERSDVPAPPNPRNLTIEWEQPCVHIDRVCIDLGVVDTQPDEYIRNHASELKQPSEIPNICSCHMQTVQLPPPLPHCSCKKSKLITTVGTSAHVGSTPSVILEGDVQALS